MSRIGIGNNVIQPDSKCINCKYWKNASKNYFGYGTSGNCSLGYCKKEQLNSKRRKVK